MTEHLKESCIFCKIIKGECPSYKILETDLNYAFLDIGPVSEGHALIIPKFHSNRMDEVPDEHLAEILPLAKKIAKAMGLVTYNLLQNNGKLAFQHVFHVHFHIVPKPDETHGLILTDKEWPRMEVVQGELEKVLDKIVSNL